MGNNGRNVRMSRRQIERRRRKRLQKRISYLVLAVVLFMLILCIRNIYARLEEMQTTLKRLEKHDSVSDTSVYGMDEQEGQETDYISSIHSAEVNKPIERTEEEVLQRLKELGQTDSAIQGIYENYSQYPKDLLSALANNPAMTDFAAGYLKGKKNSTGALTAVEKEEDFTLFLQWDPRWGYRSYGSGSCIGLAGCGPTCLSMALFYLTRDDKLTPNMIADYSMENGY